MNWLTLLLAFSLAMATGAWLARLFEQSRPQWNRRRRLLVAALVLPIFVVFATLVGIAWIVVVGPGTGENMQDLAVVATAAVGGVFALLTFIGGLVGASLAQRRS